jgi:hypothetical protein
MLFFFWDDMRDFGTGEYIEYQTFGTAPGRVFNLFYRNRLLATACGSDVMQLMVQIHEGSNVVNVRYIGNTGCASMRGNTATLGFQGPGGATAQARMAGFNSPVLDDNVSTNSMSFQPPP